ncbi:MAG TPA: FG-GAP-like repeat-containing protein [Saprospiraceae bacterium]|nr:FG-GAP-like repeat-containing protein [Saprospiraceae bacterium]
MAKMKFQVVFCTVAVCCLTVVTQAQVTFQQIPGLAFFDNQGYLNGVSWVDVDNDNDLDVCVTGSGGSFPNFTNISAIYLNNGNETFANTGLLTSTQKNPFRHGWADYDNDDDLDLYIGATWNNNGINELWRNNGSLGFSLTPGTGATPNNAQPYEGTVSWADYNNDGWADLFIPRWNDLKNKLYRNNGNGTFSDITAGAIVNDLAWTSGGYWGDFDNDRDQDLYVVNYQIGSATPGNNDLFRNNGDGTFTKITTAGQVVTLQQNGRSANWVDVNNDGYLDLFVCNQFGQDLLHINNGDATFSTQPIGATNHTSWSSNWGDYDNDGDQDLITIGFWNTDSRFWQNDGHGNLTDITAAHPNIFPLETNGSNANGIVWVDYNRDGWLDLHITQPDVSPDRFFENEKTSCRSWLEVKCLGMQSNHAAIGATVRAKALVGGQPVWQMRQVSAQTASVGTNPMLLHFGFDDAAVIDSLVVEWPSGQTCYFTQFQVNQIVDIREDCSVQVTQEAPELPGITEEIILCQPADTSTQLPSGVTADGIWEASCGVCVDQTGQFMASGLAAGDYWVRHLQGSGICGASLDSFLVRVVAQSVITASPDTVIGQGEKLVLTASGANTYLWTPSDGLNCSSCPSPSLQVDSSVVFTVSGFDANGCPAVPDQVSVMITPEPMFDMPNAFTPNGDGVNDTFGPAYKGNIFSQFQLRIINRWGQEVFVSDFPSEPWKGMIGDKSLPSDVYVYRFAYTLINGENGMLTGEVTLIR